MRAFIALEIPDEIRSNLLPLQRELERNFGRKIKRVEPENLHLTFRFFPDLAEENATKIKEIIKTLDFEAFPVECKGLGVFPNEKFVRVLWAGLESNGKLDEIESVLDLKLSEIGIKKEKDERFVSHITLARVKERIDIKEFLTRHRESRFGSFIVTKENIKLKKSQLTPNGPIYTDA